jgi:site-specific recombinase XerD
MQTVPEIVIYVRHSAGCKFTSDERSHRCNCRKFLRWTAGGKRHKRAANTRSWAEAEKLKRDLEDQFSGKVDESKTEAKMVQDAIKSFLLKKTVEKLSHGVRLKYQRLLDRLKAFCDERGIYTVMGITPEILIEFCATWEELYPSSITQANQRERLRSFLGFCYQSMWLRRVPDLPKITRDEPETQPLTPEEYKRLIDVVYITVGNGDPRRQTTGNAGGRWQYRDAAKWQHAVYSFLQTMRWAGLAIRDTMTLRRDALKFDADQGIYLISTRRAKTGVPVCIPISKEVGDDLLKVEIGGLDYFFWSGVGKPQSATSNWGQRYIAPCFKAAGITSDGNMLSHRLRDTFAVHLLEHGASMEDVARLLGNSIRVCEKHYAKWSKGRQDRINNFVGGTWTVPKKRNRPGRKPSGGAQVATRLELVKKSA